MEDIREIKEFEELANAKEKKSLKKISSRWENDRTNADDDSWMLQNEDFMLPAEIE